MHGVLAIGDSIANGHGDMVNAVQSQSYALWLAHAGEWSFRAYSIGGSTSQRVVDEQLPRIGEGRFDLIAVSVGTNDFLTGVPLATFEASLQQILTTAAKSAGRMVVTNVPLSAGRRPGARDHREVVLQFNEVIGSVAAERGAIAVDISGFRGPSEMRADRVHPNALGQLRIATLAAAALRKDGVAISAPAQYTLGRPNKPPGPAALIKYAGRTPAVAARHSVKRLLGRG